MSTRVQKNDDISSIENGEFIFCKELGKGFIKRDISSLGVVEFEAVCNSIEALDLGVLNTLGLDSVIFLDGNISISDRLQKSVMAELNGMENILMSSFIDNKKAVRRYFDVEEFINSKVSMICNQNVDYDPFNNGATLVSAENHVTTEAGGGDWTLADVLGNKQSIFSDGYYYGAINASVKNAQTIDIVDAGEGNTFKINTILTYYNSAVNAATDPFEFFISDDGVNWTSAYKQNTYLLEDKTHNINLESRFVKLVITPSGQYNEYGRIYFVFDPDNQLSSKDVVDCCFVTPKVFFNEDDIGDRNKVTVNSPEELLALFKTDSSNTNPYTGNLAITLVGDAVYNFKNLLTTASHSNPGDYPTYPFKVYALEGEEYVLKYENTESRHGEYLHEMDFTTNSIKLIIGSYLFLTPSKEWDITLVSGIFEDPNSLPFNTGIGYNDIKDNDWEFQFDIDNTDNMQGNFFGINEGGGAHQKWMIGPSSLYNKSGDIVIHTNGNNGATYDAFSFENFTPVSDFVTVKVFYIKATNEFGITFDVGGNEDTFKITPINAINQNVPVTLGGDGEDWKNYVGNISNISYTLI